MVLLSRELRELLIAWVVLSLCFSIRAVFSPTPFPHMLAVALATVGLGFASHELAHRYVARAFGYWAEFRLWVQGLMMALLLSVVSMGQIIFAVPGAVLIAPRRYFPWGPAINRRERGLIALAGPAANIALAIAFLLLTSVGGSLRFMAAHGRRVNLWLAMFNMIPLGPADGRKVFQWNRLVWAAVTIPLGLAMFLG